MLSETQRPLADPSPSKPAHEIVLDSLLSVALDLTRGLTESDRYERLLRSLRSIVPCDACSVLRFDGEAFVPMVSEGLAPEVMGQRFVPSDHPRLFEAMHATGPVRFKPEDPRPDPFDGLIEKSTDGHARVHACMACPLHVEGELVGLFTADSLDPNAFTRLDEKTFTTFAAFAAAIMRSATIIEALENSAKHHGLVAQELVKESLKSGTTILLGTSAPMRQLKKEIEVVSDSDLPVLVFGETGTGKEVVTHALHSSSRRKDKPLIYVNCAALPEALFESELFGHVKGSFTGAIATQPGKFELADDGTLVLDEVGELPLATQAKLLRALQFGEIQRVGASQSLRVNVRIIAVTNRDLGNEVKAGHFRADLYHRLSVYPIRVPPLRERMSDIPVLSGHFIDQARVRLGVKSVRLTKSARLELERYAWPGNVRELEHLILRAVLRASAGRRLETVVVDSIHLALSTTDVSSAEDGGPAVKRGPNFSLPEATKRFQRDAISQALKLAKGNWAEAARRLKMDRGNLHRLGQRLGLKD
jgi:anaerobic nitric oxide reductase transcription regulator